MPSVRDAYDNETFSEYNTGRQAVNPFWIDENLLRINQASLLNNSKQTLCTVMLTPKPLLPGNWLLVPCNKPFKATFACQGKENDGETFTQYDVLIKDQTAKMICQNRGFNQNGACIYLASVQNIFETRVDTQCQMQFNASSVTFMDKNSEQNLIFLYNWLYYVVGKSFCLLKYHYSNNRLIYNTFQPEFIWDNSMLLNSYKDRFFQRRLP